MFAIEDMDLKELNAIEDTINKGGQIFFALDDENHVMACCEIAPRDDGDWEIMKFAADDRYAGHGAGSLVFQACLDYAKKIGLKRIIIVSNKRCVSAVHLYRKFGFIEMRVDRTKFPFERADIAFYKNL